MSCIFKPSVKGLSLLKSTFRRPALIIGVISIICALYSGIPDKFTDWILLIGGLFTPVFAILIADFIFIKKGKLNTDALMSEEKNEYWYTGGYNLLAWAVYFICAGLAFYWTKINPLVYGVTVPVFICAFFGYIAVCKIFPKTSVRTPS